MVQYDGSVRSTIGEIVEFNYGGDGLDPIHMESKILPVDPHRQFIHVQAIYPNKEEVALKSDEVMPTLREILNESIMEGIKSNEQCYKIM